MEQQANPPRWAADPTGTHELRYWDGTRWTEHVSDHGAVTTAPLGGAAVTVAAPSNSWAAVDPSIADATAVMGRRYGAFFIDLAVCLAAFTIVFFPLATKRTRAETLQLPGCHLLATDRSQVGCDNRTVFQVNGAVYEAPMGSTGGLWALFTVIYFGLFEGVVGATLGKLATGIRVVKEDGTIVGVPKALVRWLLLAVDGPLSLFLCGVITSSVSKGHRRLGDMVAHTYVVGKSDVQRPA